MFTPALSFSSLLRTVRKPSAKIKNPHRGHEYEKARQIQDPHFQTASCVALLVAGANAGAAEVYKLRQSPIGVFGGEMAAGVDNAGFFGTASVTYLNIERE